MVESNQERIDSDYKRGAAASQENFTSHGKDFRNEDGFCALARIFLACSPSGVGETVA
jgi:hypothetical protein